MKKLLTLTLALALTLSLAACGGKADTPASTPQSTAPSSSTASVASTAPAPESTAPAEDYPYTVQVQIKSPTTADIVLGGVTVKNDIVDTRWGVTLDNKYAVSLDVYEAGKYQCSTTKIVVDGKYTNYDLINPEIPYTIGEGTLTIHVDFTGVEGFDFNKVATYTTEISEDGKGWRPTDFAAADVVGTAPPAESKPATDTPAASTPAAPAQDAASAKSSYAGTYTVGKDDESIVITQSGDMLVVEITVNNIGDNQTVKSGTYTTSFAISDIKVDSNNVGIVKTTTTDGLSCAIYFNGAEGPTAGVEIILEGVYSLARSRG